MYYNLELWDSERGTYILLLWERRWRSTSEADVRRDDMRSSLELGVDDENRASERSLASGQRFVVGRRVRGCESRGRKARAWGNNVGFISHSAPCYWSPPASQPCGVVWCGGTALLLGRATQTIIGYFRTHLVKISVNRRNVRGFRSGTEMMYLLTNQRHSWSVGNVTVAST